MATPTPPSEPSPPHPEQPPKKSFKEKFQDSFDQLKTNEKLSHLSSFATSNTRDSIAYVILIIGIILLFFHPFYGGILIGIIAGFYFSSELLALLQSINSLIDEQGIVRSLIAGGLLLGLFVSASSIFVGMAIAVVARQILFPEKTS